MTIRAINETVRMERKSIWNHDPNIANGTMFYFTIANTGIKNGKFEGFVSLNFVTIPGHGWN